MNKEYLPIVDPKHIKKYYLGVQKKKKDYSTIKIKISKNRKEIFTYYLRKKFKSNLSFGRLLKLLLWDAVTKEAEKDLKNIQKKINKKYVK